MAGEVQERRRLREFLSHEKKRHAGRAKQESRGEFDPFRVHQVREPRAVAGVGDLIVVLEKNYKALAGQMRR